MCILNLKIKLVSNRRAPHKVAANLQFVKNLTISVKGNEAKLDKQSIPIKLSYQLLLSA